MPFVGEHRAFKSDACLLVALVFQVLPGRCCVAAENGLTLAREDNWLMVRSAAIPGGEVRVNYLEAYCRAGSTDADWSTHTVIKHANEVLSLSDDRKVLRLRDTLADGLIVEHTITAGADEVDFKLVARNPTSRRSEAHWAQPCVRLGTFTGFPTETSKADINDYLPKCFLFLDGKLVRMPTADWATRARYIPGQVWAAPQVPRADVNPRPLSSRTPSNGLIGCFSADEKMLFATAWEPYQELFQGVIRCLHSDFRLGGLGAGETRNVRGKMYFVPNDVPALLRRYAADFPEPAPQKTKYFRSDRGTAAAAGLPADLARPDNLSWRMPLEPGHSTPVITQGRIFLTTYRPAERELATIALDHNDGKQLWKQTVVTDQIEEVHPQMGNPATPTPATDGQRVYVFFGSYGLICYDFDGKKLWEKRMGPFRDEYGAGSSPVVLDDKVILNQDHDLDSFLLAVDAASGKTLWQTARPEAVRSYATPVPWKNGKEILVAGALELASYAADTGNKLWWINGLARIVIPLPVLGADMIYMASWAPGGDAGARVTLDPWPQAAARWDNDKDGQLAEKEINDREVLNRFFRMDLDQNGKLNRHEWEKHSEVFQRAQNAILALRPPVGRGDLTEGALVWKYHRGVPYVATPLLDQGIVWMVKDGGIVTKLDAQSGSVLQEERLPALGNYYASPVSADGKVYFASEPGVVTVVSAERAWRVISSHHLREKIYATPVIDRDRIYLRTEKALYCFRQLAATQ